MWLCLPTLCKQYSEWRRIHTVKMGVCEVGSENGSVGRKQCELLRFLE